MKEDHDEDYLFRGESKCGIEDQYLVDAASYADAWKVKWKAIEHEVTTRWPDGTTITVRRRIEQ